MAAARLAWYLRYFILWRLRAHSRQYFRGRPGLFSELGRRKALPHSGQTASSKTRGRLLRRRCAAAARLSEHFQQRTWPFARAGRMNVAPQSGHVAATNPLGGSDGSGGADFAAHGMQSLPRIDAWWKTRPQLSHTAIST